MIVKVDCKIECDNCYVTAETFVVPTLTSKGNAKMSWRGVELPVGWNYACKDQPWKDRGTFCPKCAAE